MRSDFYSFRKITGTAEIGSFNYFFITKEQQKMQKREGKQYLLLPLRLWVFLAISLR